MQKPKKWIKANGKHENHLKCLEFAIVQEHVGGDHVFGTLSSIDYLYAI